MLRPGLRPELVQAIRQNPRGGGPVWTLVSVPAGFSTVWTPDFDVLSMGETCKTSVDWDALIPIADKTRYVDATATGAANGTSWTDAYTIVQDAITEAIADATVTRVYIRAGTYDGWTSGTINHDLAIIADGGVVTWSPAVPGAFSTATDGTSTHYFEGIIFDQCMTTDAWNEIGCGVATFVDCTFINGTQNGLGLDKCHAVYVKNCIAHNNADDGFNYHDTTGLATNVLEEGCVSYDNGTDTIDNASTMHEDGNAIVRVGGVYSSATGPVVNDVGTGVSWCVGCYSHTPLALATLSAANAAFAVCWKSDRVGMWLDRCSSSGQGWGAFENAAGTIYITPGSDVVGRSGDIQFTATPTDSLDTLIEYWSIYNGSYFEFGDTTYEGANIAKNSSLIRLDADPSVMTIYGMLPRVASGTQAGEFMYRGTAGQQPSHGTRSGRNVVTANADILISNIAKANQRYLHDGSGCWILFGGVVTSLVDDADLLATSQLGAAASTGHYWSISTTGGLICRVSNGTAAIIDVTSAAGGITLNTPFLVAVRFKSDTYECWLNGTRVVNEVPSGECAAGDSAVNIKSLSYNGSDNPFTGDLLAFGHVSVYPDDADFHTICGAIATRIGATW